MSTTGANAVTGVSPDTAVTACKFSADQKATPRKADARKVAILYKVSAAPIRISSEGYVTEDTDLSRTYIVTTIKSPRKSAERMQVASHFRMARLNHVSQVPYRVMLRCGVLHAFAPSTSDCIVLLRNARC